MSYIDLNEVAARMQVSRMKTDILLACGDTPKPTRIERLHQWHLQIMNEWLLTRAHAVADTTIRRGGLSHPCGRP